MDGMDATVTAYEMCSNRSITYHSVFDSPFEAFSDVVQELCRTIDENTLDDEWRSLIVAFNRYRYDASHVPLPFDHPYLQSRLELTKMRQTIELAEYTRPTMADMARKAMVLLEELVQSRRNPLQAEIISKLQDRDAGTSVAIVLKHSRLALPLRDFLATDLGPNVDIVDPNALRRANVWDRMFYIGSVRDFDDYVFSAPRSRYVELIGYPWQRGKWQRSDSFLGGTIGTGPIRHLFSQSSQSQIDTLSTLDLDRIQDRLQKDDEGAEEEEELSNSSLVNARLYELFGGKAVLLEASDRNTNMVIDLDADQEGRVCQVSDRETEEGMFIVLRTGSRGGYIAAIANQIIGEPAASYRKILIRWKSRLRAIEKQEGIHVLVDRLIESESKRASPQNTRNWISTQSIAPESSEDFYAIAILCGLGNEFDSMLRSAQQLRRAHVHAGQRVRRKLRELVKDADVEEIERQGSQQFEDPEFEGAKLTAYRIERRSGQIVSVAASSLERVFDLDVF